MKKIFFIADFFKKDVLGGAESNDAVLIQHLLSEGYQVEKIKCADFTPDLLNKKYFFIISNFVSLSEAHKIGLKNEEYIIYEHDHKYLKSRDPSVYSDFIAPPDQIINQSFYQYAKATVVLSKICKEVIEKNLDIDNVYSIGCSLWSDEKLDFIETLMDTEKNEKFAIINSSNPIKNTQLAVSYCRKKNVNFETIGPCDENELLTKLANYKGLVFFPKVLETFSRISVEAKLLNCKLITKPRLLGAASEDIFCLSGKELMANIRNRKSKALKLFEKLITKAVDPVITDKSITVILNCYRRPEYLEEQIAAIRAQSIKPDQIWVWVNHHDDNKDFDFSKLNVDRIFNNDYNWKYYGRFAAALLADTKYVALFDDDTIPGKKWFENCLRAMKLSPGIMGGAGVVVEGKQYQKHTRYGWSSQNKHIVRVDLVGHAWFFEQDWVKYLWLEKPFTWDNGEDIQFSFCCQKYGGIQTYCPPHPKDDLEMFSSLKGYQYGVDDKASSNARNHSLFYKQRDACVKNAIDNGWKTVLMEIE